MESSQPIIVAGSLELLDDATRARFGFLAGYRGSTRSAYHLDLEQFVGWCRMNRLDLLRDVTRTHIEVYGRWQEEVRGLKPSTVSRRIGTVILFYRWCEVEELVHKSPGNHVRRIKVDSAGKTAGLDRNELSRFLVTAGSLGGIHHALGELLAINGLRISEALATDIAGMTYERGHQTLAIVRKGSKEEVIPLAPRVARAIISYLGERVAGPVFVDGDGITRLSRQKAATVVLRIGRHAGLGHVHPHMLRVAAITGCLDAGGTIRDVQYFAGHEDPRTTMRYDRRRHSLDQHTTYLLAGWVATGG